VHFKGINTAILALSSCAVLFIGCAFHQFPRVQPVNEPDRRVIEKDKAQDCFVQARDFERRGVIEMAEHYYEMAYNFDPTSETLRDEVVRRYIESDKPSRALLLVKGSRTNQELSLKEKRQVSTIYIKMGEFNKAAEVLEMIPDKSDEEVYSLGLIYESLNNNQNALKNYLDYFNRNPESMQMGYKIGKLLINSKRYSEAESLYTGMMTRLGDKPDIYVMIGGLRIIQGDTAKGLELFSKALTIDSTHEDALRSTAQIYLTRNDYPNAIVNYEKLYHYNSLGEVYGRTLAILYFYNKQYTNAEQLLNDLLKNAIDDYELHFYMGLVFEALKKNDLAFIEFEKTLTIRNTFDDCWKEMCYLALRNKMFDEALVIAERYIKIVPDKSDPWKLKGYAHNLRKEYGKSIDAFIKAIEFDNTDVYTWFELGSAYERNGDYDKSIVAFKKVLKARPDDPATLNYLGYMWAEKKMNLDSAKTLIEKALKVDPENGAFLDSYAWVFYQMGSIDSAAKYMGLAVKKISDDPVVYSHLGDILLMKNDYKSALDAFSKSLALDADDAENIRKKITDLESKINVNRSKK
jgi:tetratricopeptide (TPR) repeat protein